MQAEDIFSSRLEVAKDINISGKRGGLISVRHYQRQFILNLNWTKALIKEYSLVVDALIIYDLVDVVVINFQIS